MQTRVLFINVLLYNPNLRLLTSATISIETPPTSRMKPFLTMQTVPLHMLLLSEALEGPLVVEGIVAFLVGIFIVLELHSIWRAGLMYPLKSSWWIADWACFVLFIYSFGYRFRALFAVQVLARSPLRTSPFPSEDEYISYAHAFDSVTQYANSMSLNIVLAWLKTFKYLQFVPFMRVLLRALGNSVAQILSFVVLGAVATLGFVMAHHLALGHQLKELRSLSITFLTLYRTLMGLDIYEELYDGDRMLGQLLYYGWTLVGYMLLLNFFFAILNGALEETKNALPRIDFFENVRTFALATDAWLHAELAKFISRRGLAKMDGKISKLPMPANRTEQQKFLFDAYILEKDAKRLRYHMQQHDAKHKRAQELNVMADGQELEQIELRLAKLVGAVRERRRKNTTSY